MKWSSKPPIPPEMSYVGREGTMEERCDWNAVVRKYSQRVRKFLRKYRDENSMDMTDAMIKRRSRALVEYIPKIIERYRDVPGYEWERRDYTGETFVDLNLVPVTTYNFIEEQSYILLAASIWILDEIMATGDREKRRKLFRLLPRDEDELYESWSMPDIWHTDYNADLIASVQYVLTCRNRDIDGFELEDNTKRLLTSSLIAREGQRENVPSREAFERLMELIPRESIERAAAYFEELLWQWTDRFFECVLPLDDAIRKANDKTNSFVSEYNKLRAELEKGTAEMLKKRGNKKSQAKPPAFNPLLANPVPQMPDLFKSGFIPPTSPLAGAPLRGGADEDPSQRVYDAVERMVKVSDRFGESMEKKNECETKKAEFTMHVVRMGCIREHEGRERFGDEAMEQMKPLNILRPFEACFGLLWLIENGSDLPWLYGCGCGLMQEVTESLPWGVFQYDEMEDPVWHPENWEEEEEQLSFLEDVPKKGQSVKPSGIPEWYERKYIPKEDEPLRFNRSMAQILYEETGCILSSDMHKYDILQKDVKRYGVTGKDITALLMLFTALGNARRSRDALNLDQALMEIWDEEEEDSGEGGDGKYEDGGEDEEDREQNNRRAEKAAKGSREEDKPLTYEELAEKLKAEQENNKKLRSSLHEAEKNSREVRKELAAVRESAAMEHRELADLREVVFNAENNGENAEEREAEEEQFDGNLFPYEVIKDTIVFGGHETWLKAIRPMLTGNIRFLDKDMNFDIKVIRNAEVIWIQTNAISHKQYYRIMDAARQWKKPVRYFAHASAAKGAMQIVSTDRGGERGM